MADKTDTERIAYLEKRVAELQKELSEAQTPRRIHRCPYRKGPGMGRKSSQTRGYRIWNMLFRKRNARDKR